MKHTRNPLRFEQEHYYYDLERTDVIEAVRAWQIKGKRVLELGCSAGRTAHALRPVLETEHYTGIELDSTAAAKAKTYLDQVLIVNLDQTPLDKLGLEPMSFDVLIACDILEHLYNPWDVLAEAVDLLVPGGYVVLSIPNTQNIQLIHNLIQGHWSYQSEGLLDATHIRFFTMASIKDLILGAGLILKDLKVIFNPKLDAATLQETDNAFQQDNIMIADLTRDDVIRLFTYQYLVLAQKQN
jgi:2-polyprenyl-3-methyl-5-hydroxy-6-metoxy-1,4-benzoquinol methylase